MRDSRKGLTGMTKRELVGALVMEVEQWAGDAPLAEKRREQAAALLTALSDCPLWLAESHWHALCSLWLSRSARPDSWLREFWLETLQQWQRFLVEDGFEPDSRPEAQISVRRIDAFDTSRAPSHLPFGFIKPWT